MHDGPTVSNSSALIALDKVGLLHLLKALYGEISVPPAVLREWGVQAPIGITEKAPRNQSLVTALRL